MIGIRLRMSFLREAEMKSSNLNVQNVEDI